MKSKAICGLLVLPFALRTWWTIPPTDSGHALAMGTVLILTSIGLLASAGGDFLEGER